MQPHRILAGDDVIDLRTASDLITRLKRKAARKVYFAPPRHFYRHLHRIIHALDPCHSRFLRRPTPNAPPVPNAKSVNVAGSGTTDMRLISKLFATSLGPELAPFHNR